MKVVAIIQARAGSSRFPRKVLKMLGKRTVLEWVVARTSASKGIDEVYVATTTSQGDDEIVRLCQEKQIHFFRGSEADVLGRYYALATKLGATDIVRITADCPLLDTQVLERVVGTYLSRKSRTSLEYLSNTLERSFPRGLDVEVFSYEVLKKMNRVAREPYHREHVTSHITNHRDQYRVENYSHPTNFSQHRWTLDTLEDYRFLQSIYKNFEESETFGMVEILDFLHENPTLLDLNSGVQQHAE